MIQYDFSLKQFNTFGIDVKAKAFSSFSTVDELVKIIQTKESSLPLFILGGGSNILFTKDVEALVLKNNIEGIECVAEDSSFVEYKVGAGVVWHQFVQYTVEKGLGGIENLSLIPGSVGASPMQNIGAYGTEIKDCFVSLDALNLETLKIEYFDKDKCNFGYRESVFKRELKNKYIITSVTYRLSKKPKLNTEYGAIKEEIERMDYQEISVKSVSQAVINIRNSKLPNPKILGNAGSFFKNPVISYAHFIQLKEQYPNIPNYPQANGEIKIAAGWLIEQAGWKGKRVENCGVHEKQALVLVNYGDAKGNEIYALSSQIIHDIHQKFGIVLEREVNIF